jgi:hypothetical protein
MRSARLLSSGEQSSARSCQSRSVYRCNRQSQGRREPPGGAPASAGEALPRWRFVLPCRCARDPAAEGRKWRPPRSRCSLRGERPAREPAQESCAWVPGRFRIVRISWAIISRRGWREMKHRSSLGPIKRIPKILTKRLFDPAGRSTGPRVCQVSWSPHRKRPEWTRARDEMTTGSASGRLDDRSACFALVYSEDSVATRQFGRP